MATETKNDYILLFRGTEWDHYLSPEELQQVMHRVMAWFDRLQQQGIVKAGQPLGEGGRTVSGKRGRTVADGPFAESKEAIGGYLVLRVASLEQAVAIAKTNPTLDYGATIEVRPVLEECPVFQRVKDQLADAAA